MGNGGFKNKKKKKLIARVGIRGQKETIFESFVAILHDKNNFGPYKFGQFAFVLKKKN